MKDLTMILPHYCNLGMLAEHQRIWADYPADLRRRLHVVIVDDCSPKGSRPSAKIVANGRGLGSLRIFRLMRKIRWNWLAARNLGAQVARSTWLLLTDVDHGLPAETLGYVLEASLNPHEAYRFSRVDAPRRYPYTLSECAPYKPHNDTWLMTRDLFFYDDGKRKFVQGYDERLSGLYGTSGEFRDRVFGVAPVMQLPKVVIRYPREIVPDASTHPTVYARKGDSENDAELGRRKLERAAISDWRPLHGLVRHELIYDSTIEAVA